MERHGHVARVQGADQFARYVRLAEIRHRRQRHSDVRRTAGKWSPSRPLPMQEPAHNAGLAATTIRKRENDTSENRARAQSTCT